MVPGGQVCRPGVHQPAPSLEQVRAPLRGLDLVADRVCKRASAASATSLG